MLASTLAAGCAARLPPPDWPPAEATDLPPSPLQPPRSLLVVATHVDLSPFGAALESALAALGPSERRGRVALPGGGALGWELGRAPLALTVTPPRGDGDAVVHVTERIALALSFDAGASARCTTDGAALVVSAEATPALAPGDGLALALEGARISVEVEGAARCAIGLGPAPAASAPRDAPRSSGAAVQLGVALGPLLRPLFAPLAALASTALGAARVPLSSVERQLVEALAAPIPIARADGSAACLALHAGDLILGPIDAASDGRAALDVALGLEVAPVLSLAPCPPPPPSSSPRALRVARAPLAARFTVEALIAIPLSTVEDQLRAALTGTTLGAGRRAVTLGAPSLRSARGRLFVSVPVDGALHGTLLLWGTPTVEPPAAIGLPDLRLALASRSALERAHFARLAADDAPGAPTARARAALRRDLSPLVDELRAALAAPRALGGALLAPTIAALRPAAVRVAPEGIRLTIIADGTARLTLPVAEAPR